MVCGWSAPVTIGKLVSQCAEAMRIAFGLPRRLPSAAHARPAAPASRACIGEPWEMNTLGRGTMDYAPRAGSLGIKPSACIASLTFGRAATRWLYFCTLGHFERSMLVGFVELERRHVALRVHLPEVAAAIHRLVFGVDLLQLDVDARFARHDVGRERAGAGGVIKLHAFSPLWGLGQSLDDCGRNADRRALLLSDVHCAERGRGQRYQRRYGDELSSHG